MKHGMTQKQKITAIDLILSKKSEKDMFTAKGCYTKLKQWFIESDFCNENVVFHGVYAYGYSL